MDLKAFYQKIRETESSIVEEVTVTVSLSTPDGGRAGVLAEVPRSIAARTIVEGKAQLATDEQAAAYRLGIAAARKAAEDKLAAGQARYSVIAETDLRALRAAVKPAK